MLRFAVACLLAANVANADQTAVDPYRVDEDMVPDPIAKPVYSEGEQQQELDEQNGDDEAPENIHGRSLKPRYSSSSKSTYRAPTARSSRTYKAPTKRSAYTRTTSRRTPSRTTVYVKPKVYVAPVRVRSGTVKVYVPTYRTPTARVYINANALFGSAVNAALSGNYRTSGVTVRRSGYYRTTNRRSRIVLRTTPIRYTRTGGRRTVVIRRMARALVTSMAVVAAGVSALAI